MTRIQVMSDLHLEFGGELPQTRDDADIVVYAGDIDRYEEGVIGRLKDRAGPQTEVVYVLGNHEHYDNDVVEVRGEAAREADQCRAHLLDPGTAIVHGIRFIGATLWTDMALCGEAMKPMVRRLAHEEMNDFRGAIWNEGALLTTEDTGRWHVEQLQWICDELGMDTTRRHNVVVTHHGPSPSSVNSKYTGDLANALFVSDLDRIIARYQPRAWIHGHVHDSVDRMLGDTRLLANPRGYPHERNPTFDPRLVIDLD